MVFRDDRRPISGKRQGPSHLIAQGLQLIGLARLWVQFRAFRLQLGNGLVAIFPFPDEASQDYTHVDQSIAFRAG